MRVRWRSHGRARPSRGHDKHEFLWESEPSDSSKLHCVMLFCFVSFCFLFHWCNYSRRYRMKPHTELIPGRTWKQRFQDETEDSSGLRSSHKRRKVAVSRCFPFGPLLHFLSVCLLLWSVGASEQPTVTPGRGAIAGGRTPFI